MASTEKNEGPLNPADGSIDEADSLKDIHDIDSGEIYELAVVA
jgi:hypothetical protein